MLHALIVDDEPLACAELEALLREIGTVEVAGRCLNAVGRSQPEVS
jgi:hypothetical protein